MMARQAIFGGEMNDLCWYISLFLVEYGQNMPKIAQKSQRYSEKGLEMRKCPKITFRTGSTSNEKFLPVICLYFLSAILIAPQTKAFWLIVEESDSSVRSCLVVVINVWNVQRTSDFNFSFLLDIVVYMLLQENRKEAYFKQSVEK